MVERLELVFVPNVPQIFRALKKPQTDVAGSSTSIIPEVDHDIQKSQNVQLNNHTQTAFFLKTMAKMSERTAVRACRTFASYLSIFADRAEEIG